MLDVGSARGDQRRSATTGKRLQSRSQHWDQPLCPKAGLTAHHFYIASEMGALSAPLFGPLNTVCDVPQSRVILQRVFLFDPLTLRRLIETIVYVGRIMDPDRKQRLVQLRQTQGAISRGGPTPVLHQAVWHIWMQDLIPANRLLAQFAHHCANTYQKRILKI